LPDAAAAEGQIWHVCRPWEPAPGLGALNPRNPPLAGGLPSTSSNGAAVANVPGLQPGLAVDQVVCPAAVGGQDFSSRRADGWLRLVLSYVLSDRPRRLRL